MNKREMRQWDVFYAYAWVKRLAELKHTDIQELVRRGCDEGFIAAQREADSEKIRRAAELAGHEADRALALWSEQVAKRGVFDVE